MIDIYCKYAWVIITLKDKKGITITGAFQKILDEPNHKLNKIWVDKSSEFYNTSLRSWLEKKRYRNVFNNTEGKSVVAERFIRTLKNTIYEDMTLVSKNV